nr:hypothetical protein [uncultured Sphaerochaeta sp.]
MKERPIIMGAESVRAILEGRKTQTRRVIDPRKYNIGGWDMPVSKSDVEAGYLVYQDNNGDFHSVLERCPYGKVGDRLWVREAYQLFDRPDHEYPMDVDWYEGAPRYALEDGYSKDSVGYKADADSSDIPWRSPIFMPRWASRITLEITELRVERVQDISEDDAIAEGTSRDFAYECNGWVPSYTDPDSGGYADYIAAYRTLWTSLNAKRGYPWENNDLVRVITFKAVENGK